MMIEIYIFLWKYIVLSINEEEEGEIVGEDMVNVVGEGNMDEKIEILDEDIIEDGLLECSRGNNKVVG